MTPIKTANSRAKTFPAFILVATLVASCFFTHWWTLAAAVGFNFLLSLVIIGSKDKDTIRVENGGCPPYWEGAGMWALAVPGAWVVERWAHWPQIIPPVLLLFCFVLAIAHLIAVTSNDTAPTQ